MMHMRSAGMVALVLLPLAGAYAVLIWQTQHTPLLAAMAGGSVTAAAAAVAYALVSRIGERLGWNQPTKRRLLALHVVLAVTFAVAWTVSVTAIIALGNPSGLRPFLQDAIGWQAFL